MRKVVIPLIITCLTLPCVSSGDAGRRDNIDTGSRTHQDSDEMVSFVRQIRKAYGPQASTRAKQWVALVEEIRKLSDQQRLIRVNEFFNQLTYITDDNLWGKEDYWATLPEFLGVNGGDCEDFSFAKYFTLLYSGIEDSKLRLVYVQALAYDEPHMVLAYHSSDDSDPLILDNIEDVIRPASARVDLSPIYSFDGQDVWVMKQKSQGNIVGKSSMIKPWVQLRQRAKDFVLQQPMKNLN